MLAVQQAQPAAKRLVEVPPHIRPGEVFRVAVAGHKLLPVACPINAGPGDVLELPRFPGDDPFLSRLGQAESRDAKRPVVEQAHLEATSPTYGWRIGKPARSPGFDPYLTTQQQQNRAMQASHHQALLREQQRAHQQQLEHDASVMSGALAARARAGRNVRSSGSILRPLACLLPAPWHPPTPAAFRSHSEVACSSPLCAVGACIGRAACRRSACNGRGVHGGTAAAAAAAGSCDEADPGASERADGRASAECCRGAARGSFDSEAAASLPRSQGACLPQHVKSALPPRTCTTSCTSSCCAVMCCVCETESPDA